MGNDIRAECLEPSPLLNECSVERWKALYDLQEEPKSKFDAVPVAVAVDY